MTKRKHTEAVCYPVLAHKYTCRTEDCPKNQKISANSDILLPANHKRTTNIRAAQKQQEITTLYRENTMSEQGYPLSKFNKDAPYANLPFRRLCFSLKASLTQTASSLILALSLFLGASGASAEATAQIIEKGDIAITGFSGLKFPEAGIPPGVDPLDETFIKLDGASLRIYKATSMGGPAQGQLVNLPAPFEVKADQIGQVFGLTYDDGADRPEGEPKVPNLYVTSSVLHGLQIVGPDTDDDGRMERLKKGQEDAEFMEGQFGTKNGGTPGAIWKIDGITGEVTLFANVSLDGEENSGPGLGNITFDHRTRQLFVSDLDTGMIHGFNMQGEAQGTFDHGTAGRASKGLAEVAHDASNRMNIKDPSFIADKPETWGFAKLERLVYGLQVRGKRLYYYAAEGHMIMSVGINDDGSFGEASWELDVSSENNHPVTDIAFDNKGHMFLSQRGKLKNPYDYASFAETAVNNVLRYHPESPDDPATPSRWVETPASYAVGMEADHKLAVGGIDLQYGYNQDGTINFGACDVTLVKTGDNLRYNPDLIDQLSPGGALNVHGIQLTDKSLTRPANIPPWNSYYIDYDGTFDDPEVKGHVGDTEVYRPCEGQSGYNDYYPYPWDLPIPEDYPGDDIPPGGKERCVEVKAIDYSCSIAGEVQMDLYLKENAGLGADSLKAKSFTPGIHVTPKMQTVPGAAPYTLDVLGILPNENYDLGVCLYNKADADAGGEFPCCKAVLPLKAPPFACAP